LKGNLILEFNTNKTSAHLVFTPTENGEDWPEKRIKSMLESEGVNEGIIADSIKKAEESISKTDEELKILVAESENPVPFLIGNYQWETLEIPPQLKVDSERIIKNALDPEITRKIVKNIRVKKKVEQKSKLPFGKSKTAEITAVQKKIVIEQVEINPEVIKTGWADIGSVLAIKGKDTEGKPGKSVLGEEIPSETIEFYIGKGVTNKNDELIAEYSGFIRRGGNWIEILPFDGKAWIVSLTKDKSSAFLKLLPGIQTETAPSTESIIASAVSLGIPKEDLINESVINRIINETVNSGSFLENFSLSKDKDAFFSVTSSEDGMKGYLTMIKGRGNGKTLKLNQVGEAIKKSGFVGLDFNKIKEDILSFYRSSSLELKNHILIEGKAPEAGEEVTFSIDCEMMKAKELESYKEEIKKTYEKRKPKGIDSLEDYPVDSCKDIGIIKTDGTAVIFSSSKPGAPGKDIFGKVLPGLKGETPNLIVLENLVNKKEVLISEIDGYLDIIEKDKNTIVRIRPEQSELIITNISEDKMEAYLTIGDNSGNSITEAEIKEKLISDGIIKGLNDEVLKKAVEASNSGETLENLLIASGVIPTDPETSSLKMEIAVANNEAVTLLKNGSADFKNQDRITEVKIDDLIAVILSPKTKSRDGWDVTGATIEAKEAQPSKTEVGNGIKEVKNENGDISLIAEVSGELIIDGEKLCINNTHIVKGDVDLKEGNIKFPGSVKIGGSVTQGFFVMSGGEVQIAGGVEGSLISASESIIIGQGVVGGGKAILRSKQDIELAFAEQATLLAVGDIKAKNSCLRCKIKCNGKVHLIGDKGNLIGGDTKSTGGINVGNLGNSKNVKTEVSFGQNYLIQDRIEVEEKEVDKIKTQISKLDITMHQLEKETDHKKLKSARIQKLKMMKMMEKRGLRLFALRERFEEHFTSDITIRGTIYPGVILESHGRYHEITSEKKNLIITFNQQTGKIEETPIKKES
jgi:uncharacterized protein